MDKGLTVLLRDFGYRVEGHTLIASGCGFYSDRLVRKVRSLFDAAELLRPIIADEEYSARLSKLCPF